MKKTLTFLLAVLMLTALMSGCAMIAPSPAATAETLETSGPETEGQPDEMYVLFNGTKVASGMLFTDVKDSLGDEVRPSESIGSCDENSDFLDTMHYYDGLIVTEDKDGVIRDLESNEGNKVLVNGKVKIGDEVSFAIEALGEPSAPLGEDDVSINYSTEQAIVMLFFETGTDGKTISGISFIGLRP